MTRKNIWCTSLFYTHPRLINQFKKTETQDACLLNNWLLNTRGISAIIARTQKAITHSRFMFYARKGHFDGFDKTIDV